MRILRSLACMVLIAAACSKPEPTLTPLATAPDWNELEAFQETITREEFLNLLNEVYAPDGAAEEWIVVEKDQVRIKKFRLGRDDFTLRFFSHRSAARAEPKRYWNSAPASHASAEKPLTGYRIALDPGHIGGNYAQMEGRWFQVDRHTPITEGDMTLRVAALLKPKLEALGAEVFLIRTGPEPVTPAAPDYLMRVAEANFNKRVASAGTESAPLQSDAEAIKSEGERLYYRVSEIRARASLINQQVKPDLTICLHFNADDWGDPTQPEFSKENHLHLVVNGAYAEHELAYDDVRFEMLTKLLNHSYQQELAISETVAAAMAKATQLPPCSLPGLAVKKIGSSPYLWARNLLANRLYQSPTLFLEPYVMNNETVFARVQMGEYQGERKVGGEWRKNIYEEYADAVATGLANHFRKKQ